jgi:hypothetical protein
MKPKSKMFFVPKVDVAEKDRLIRVGSKSGYRVFVYELNDSLLRVDWKAIR